MQSTPARRPGELVFAVAVLLFSLAAFWQAYEISGFDGLTEPGVFPMLATGTMIVAALFILSDTARRRPDADTQAVTRRFFVDILPIRHMVLIGLVLAYLLLLPMLGFIVSSALFLLAAFQYLWRRHVLVTVVLSAGALAAVYVIFRIVFQVVLPEGSLMRGLV
ncbi:tripartite tricarboxylate transporter TctB family protein [Thalassobaculum salexigens]|mgnify:CR=1 FL=1|uniref:tripartite tricarboxylate transporter TctB family protein n=1 Tax=Thalassobaculum salexigens TaxID=455360 RepID=UPI00048AA2C5|nr:tripartite tricarboxylate transporter TctB family protein [Thalassobaculum salexigens]